MTETNHEIIIGVHNDNFVRAIRCLHIERGEVCQPSAEVQSAENYEKLLASVSWYPEQPNSRECFWDDHFFGMGNFFAWNNDQPDTNRVPIFETPVTVDSRHPLAVHPDASGTSVFTVLADQGAMSMRLDGGYVEDIDIPLEFLVIHPVQWRLEYGEVFVWETVGDKRTLMPGDADFNRYAAMTTTA